jgi:RND family efflux transporter MFP subunit
MSSSSAAPKPDLSSLRIHDEARKRSGMGKFLGIFAAILGLIVIAAAVVFAFRSKKPIVETATAEQATVGSRPALLNASGYVTPRRRATVAAKITGRVIGVYFDEGLHVKDGQVLAKLDDSDVVRALTSAVADRDSSKAAIRDYQVQLKNAEIELVRAQKLLAQGVSSQENMDTATMNADSLRAKMALAQAQVQTFDARIAEAQQAVDNTVIRAPFDGIIVSKDAQVGEMVSPISAGGGFTRTGIATLVDMNSNEIEVDVNESYIARVVTDMPVTAVLDAYPDWQIPSKVRTVIPTADRQKATVKVRISFLKLDPKILPDMGVKVTFLGEAPKEDSKNAPPAALVSSDAIRDDGGKSIVYLIKDGKLERRAVTTGNARGPETEILAGLHPGDVVVTKSPSPLKDGEEVEVKH